MAQETPGKPKFRLKLSRPMIIIVGVFVVLVVASIVLVLVLSSAGAPSSQQAAGKVGATAQPALPVVTPVSTATVGVSETVPATAPAVTAPPTPVPPTQQVAAVSTSGPTMRPAPTQAPAGNPSTTRGTGGEQPMPDTASGLPWLIPVGVVLVVAVLWWRWRRAHASD